MSKTYPLPNPAAICAAIKAASGLAINPDQPSGVIETHGCTLTYTIADGHINVAVASKPFYVSYNQIFTELDKLFEGKK